MLQSCGNSTALQLASSNCASCAPGGSPTVKRQSASNGMVVPAWAVESDMETSKAADKSLNLMLKLLGILARIGSDACASMVKSIGSDDGPAVIEEAECTICRRRNDLMDDLPAESSGTSAVIGRVATAAPRAAQAASKSPEIGRRHLKSLFGQSIIRD